jgi:3-hydroxybutyryl-CoA dehydrogenase
MKNRRASPTFTIEELYDLMDIPLSPPMGPFRLRLLKGIDLSRTMAVGAFKASRDRSLLPYPSFVEHSLKGEYGEKTGKGWLV